MTTVEVDVVRVFVDPDGQHGNLLGIIDGTLVPAPQRRPVAAELGYSETVFVDDPTSGAIQIFTPGSELRFAGHPTVGVAWWLRGQGYDAPVLRVPAGEVAVSRHGDITSVRAHANWSSTFEWRQLADPAAIEAADPTGYSSGHTYIWAWIDEPAGAIRSRMFAPALGITEDEATGSAATALTTRLGRDLHITQGAGSHLLTTHEADGWSTVGGRVLPEASRTLSF